MISDQLLSCRPLDSLARLRALLSNLTAPSTTPLPLPPHVRILNTFSGIATGEHGGAADENEENSGWKSKCGVKEKPKVM